jgi:hypothetical protein
MKKYLLVMPGTLPYGPNDKQVAVHIGIKYEDGKLSLTGVIGARAGGNCWGSCGQIQGYLTEEVVPATGWTKEMIQKLQDIWERWHLNNMRPECEHQRALGWREKAKQAVTLYNWRLTPESEKLRKTAEQAAIEALKAGETFTPTAEQAFIANLEQWPQTYEPLPADIASYYDPAKPLYEGSPSRPTETKTLGWLTTDQHPEGLLSTPCPVCGYKYGTAWLHEDVPDDVIDWLFSLPPAAKPCPWGSV